MKTNSRPCERGATLLEVMLAVFLTAVTALGVLAAQLWATRDARANALREQAVLLADAAIEARRPAARDGAAIAFTQWQARAASLLPHGVVAVSASGDGSSRVRVSWDVQANLPRSGEVIDLPVPCGDVALPANTGCVSLAFAE
jgi:Tfp pilus assembly protein PilV